MFYPVVSPFEATVRGSFVGRRPGMDGSIGGVFDPDDHAKRAICPAGSAFPRPLAALAREMIAAFLGHWAPILDARSAPGRLASLIHE